MTEQGRALFSLMSHVRLMYVCGRYTILSETEQTHVSLSVEFVMQANLCDIFKWSSILALKYLLIQATHSF